MYSSSFTGALGASPELVASISPETRIITLTGAPGVGKSTRFPAALVKTGAKVLVITATKIAAQVLSKYMSNTAVRYQDIETVYSQIKDTGIIPAIDWLIIDDIQLAKLEMSLIIVLWQYLYREKSTTARLGLIGLSVPAAFLELLTLPKQELKLFAQTYEIRVQYTDQDYEPSEIPAVINQYLHALAPVLQGNVLIILPNELMVNQVVVDLSDYTCIAVTGDKFVQNYSLLFDGSGHFNVVVATPVVEVALTIPNLSLVIDSMHVTNYVSQPNGKMLYQGLRRFDNSVSWISQEQAYQRAGRVGRTQDGVCLRLCREETFDTLPPKYPVELLLIDFGPMYLELQLLGYPKNLLPDKYSEVILKQIDLLKLWDNETLTDLIVKFPLSLFTGSLLARWVELDYPITAGVIYAAIIELGGPYIFGSVADVKYVIDDDAVIIDPNDSIFELLMYRSYSDFEFVCRMVSDYVFPKLIKGNNDRINWDILAQLWDLVQILARTLIDLSLITDVSSLEDHSYFDLNNTQLIECLPQLQNLIRQYYPQLNFIYRDADRNYINFQGEVLYLNRKYPRLKVSDVLGCLATDGSNLIQLSINL